MGEKYLCCLKKHSRRIESHFVTKINFKASPRMSDNLMKNLFKVDKIVPVECVLQNNFIKYYLHLPIVNTLFFLGNTVYCQTSHDCYRSDVTIYRDDYNFQT